MVGYTLSDFGMVGYYFAVAASIVCVAELIYRRMFEKKEQEHQDRGEKLFHELTYDKFKEKKKEGD